MSKERPILMNGEMVRATLDGSKTQTRRAIKLPPVNAPRGEWRSSSIGGSGITDHLGHIIPAQDCIWHSHTGITLMCPYGQPGDRLWVRESCQAWAYESGGYAVRYPADCGCREIGKDSEYEHWLDLCCYAGKEHAIVPSIHMPRWASRILLEVVRVRVERLQDISEEDAIAEGARRFDEIPMGTTSAHPNRWSMENPTSTDQCLSSARYAFANLYCKLYGNGKRGALDVEPWDANPWVWVVEFKVAKR